MKGFHLHDGPECPGCGQRSIENKGAAIGCLNEACVVLAFDPATREIVTRLTAPLSGVLA